MWRYPSLEELIEPPLLDELLDLILQLNIVLNIMPMIMMIKTILIRIVMFKPAAHLPHRWQLHSYFYQYLPLRHIQRHIISETP